VRFLLASVRARVSSFGRYCDVISSAGGEADGDELGVENVDDVAEEEDEGVGLLRFIGVVEVLMDDEEVAEEDVAGLGTPVVGLEVEVDGPEVRARLLLQLKFTKFIIIAKRANKQNSSELTLKILTSKTLSEVHAKDPLNF